MQIRFYAKTTLPWLGLLSNHSLTSMKHVCATFSERVISHFKIWYYNINWSIELFINDYAITRYQKNQYNSLNWC